MIAELHCHTSEYSACSHVNAVELIKKACDIGLQAVVITDHHYQWKDEDLKTVKTKAGVPDFFSVLSGQEFKTSDYGDVLVYGVKETLEKQKLTLEELKNKYPKSAVIWAHPYRKNHIPADDQLLNPLFDAIEIFSSNYTISESARALKDWHRLKFNAMAGTDTHALSYTGTYPTIFDHPFNTIEELVSEIKSGRLRPYFKEIPKSGTTDTMIREVSIGTKAAGTREKIIIKSFNDINSWKEGERTYYLIEEICKHGFDSGKYRVSKPLDKDTHNLSVMEKSISGNHIYDKIIKAEKEEARKYLKYAAEWLAEFHNNEFHITPQEEFKSIERERLEYYLSSLIKSDHPHTERVNQILEGVWKCESDLFENHINEFVQGHGDFHLKNILIGHDEKSEEDYIAAIDFNSSYQLPKAMDVGSFIAQFHNMFFDKPEIYNKAPVDIFYKTYLNKARNLPQNFHKQVELYKSRTYLSVIYYLVKVGLGNSENFWTILVNAERSLSHSTFSE